MTRTLRHGLLLLLGAACTVIGGCAAPSNPWRFNSPPTVVEPTNHAGSRSLQQRVVVVVAPFDDPTRAPNYSAGVGRAMSDAFSRALLNDGRFEVRINERLAASVRQYADYGILYDEPLPLNEREAARTRLERERGDVDYVVLGKVTDFYHSADLPDEAARWGIFGRRREAIVGLDLRIVNMETLTVVGADHLYGTSNVGWRQSSEVYDGVALDSYVFWSTPLGRAGKRAIEQAIARTESVVPHWRLARQGAVPRQHAAPEVAGTRPRSREAQANRRSVMDRIRNESDPPLHRREPTVIDISDDRRVHVRGGRDLGLVRGRRYYLVTPFGPAGGPSAVMDPVRNQPIQVVLLSVNENEAEGWMTGEPTSGEPIVGMWLSTSRPVERRVLGGLPAGE